MNIDVQLYASLELNEYIVAENGLHAAIKEGLRSMNLQFDGYLYIPQTMDNDDLIDEFDEGEVREEYSFDTNKILVVKEGLPNSHLKVTLERID